MDKHELIGLTLERLIEHFAISPESFEYTDSEVDPSRSSYPTIIWQPKVQLGDRYSTIVNDPNNCHAVVVTFKPPIDEMSCFIFLRAPSTLSGAVADSMVSVRRPFEKWRGNYRKFKKLKKMIRARDIQKENMSFLRRLSSVCPDTLDRHILKD